MRMHIRLYQIEPSRDREGLRFRAFDDLLAVYGEPDPSRYRKVFDGPVEAEDLEEVFSAFNAERLPAGYEGRSMSVSDVAVTDTPSRSGLPGAYYCDMFGYRKLPSFDESRASLEPSGCRMLVLEPGYPPYTAYVKDSLEALQAAVGGLIECTYPFDDNAFVIGNEEAKLIGMQGNRRIGGSVYAGPLLIAGDDGEGGTIDLTDEQVRLYSERFAEPEFISREEVEADTGFRIVSFD